MSPPDLGPYFRCVKHMRRVQFQGERWYHETNSTSKVVGAQICDSARILYFSCQELGRETAATAFLENKHGTRTV